MLSCSIFCLVLFCASVNLVSCYQVYVYPESGCRGTPQIFSLENAACDGVNDFFQIGTCTANSQSITIKSYSDTQCKTTPRATVTANVNTCTLDVIKYACIQGQVPTGGGGGGGGTTTKPPTTTGTTTSTPTSTSSNPTSDPNPTITPSLSSSSTSTNVNHTDINAATSTPIADNVTLTLTLVIFLVVTILIW